MFRGPSGAPCKMRCVLGHGRAWRPPVCCHVPGCRVRRTRPCVLLASSSASRRLWLEQHRCVVEHMGTGVLSHLCTLHEAIPAKGHGPGQARQGWTGPGAHGDVSLTLALCLLKAEWQVAEAEALVHTLDGWSVVESMVVPSKTPDGKLTFGKGTLEHLTGGSLRPSLPERNRATDGLSPGPYRGVLLGTWIRHREAQRASLTACSVPSGATGAIQSRGTAAPKPPGLSAPPHSVLGMNSVSTDTRGSAAPADVQLTAQISTLRT